MTTIRNVPLRGKTPNINMRELVLTNGDIVFFSYSTPVAAKVGSKFYRTSDYYSVTTTKHLNTWLARNATRNADIGSMTEAQLKALVPDSIVIS